MEQTRHDKWSAPRHHRQTIMRISVGIAAVVAVVVAAAWWLGVARDPDADAAQADGTTGTTGTTAPVACEPSDGRAVVATLHEYAALVEQASAASGCAFAGDVSAPAEDGWWFGAAPDTDLVQATRPQLVGDVAETSLVVVTRADAADPRSWGETIAADGIAVDMRRGTGVHPALRDAVLAELLGTGVETTTALTQVAGLAQRLGPTTAELTSNDEAFAALEAGRVDGFITTDAAWRADARSHDDALVARVPVSGAAPVPLGLWMRGAGTEGPSVAPFGTVALPAGAAAPGAVGTTGAAVLALPPDLRLAADAMWTSAMRPMNTLIAMDVSGSMTLPTTAGVSRLELMIQAGRTAAGMFPYHSSSLALWAFSTHRGGPGVDYTPIGASGPADPDPAAVATTQASLVAALESLPSLVGGDTGLYDTVLAAVREVRSTYVPGAVNSVVVLTDGHNDDDQSITLTALLDTLQAEADPERPIRVVTIGISSDADAASLQQIADATGGSSHVAIDPADITDILIAAMIDVERS